MGSPRTTIERTKAKHEDTLMKIPGVQGVALGEVRGKPAIIVYVKSGSPALLRKIPVSLEGFPVSVEVSGRILAQ